MDAVALAAYADRYFWPQVSKEDGHWRWTGTLHENGHGRLNSRQGPWHYAHQFSFLLAHGHLPSRVKVTCELTSCVHPDHLQGHEPDAVAVMDSDDLCPKGHRYTAKNTYIRPDNGRRECRTCRVGRVKRHRASNPSE